MNANTMTDYVILGLLSHTPMTGYDIKKHIDTTLRLFWNAGYGSIYPALNRLQKKGCITGQSQLEMGREKILYSITDAGHAVLQAWLAESTAKNEMRYETLLKVFFGDDAGFTAAQQHITAFADKTRMRIPFLETSIAQLAEHTEESAHLYYGLTALFGLKVCKAYLEWCEEANKILEDAKRT